MSSTFLLGHPVYVDPNVKYPLFLSNFDQVSIFWTNFRKILKYEIV